MSGRFRLVSFFWRNGGHLPRPLILLTRSELYEVRVRLLTVLLFGVFLVATQVFLVLKAMQDNLFERDVDPVDAVMERQASISDELTPQERCGSARTIRSGSRRSRLLPA